MFLCYQCIFPSAGAVAPNAPAAIASENASVGMGSSTGPVITIRKYFPETWIWDLVPVRCACLSGSCLHFFQSVLLSHCYFPYSQSGVVAVNKTVPDSITTWQADAFCTSPIGFGVAPNANFTAFQPFFVSLTMPSSVIRGEVFTLEATVFNYLQNCMMVS